ncbi:MAG TPA: glycosyltransferase [Dermatophilaceae bacterium]|nr:glycosyltransferase [Dermatophilaceae bacterium]
MRIGLLTAGTRGDVQPFIALALALRARGHQVVLAAPAGMRDLVNDVGLPYTPIRADGVGVAYTESGRRARGHPVETWRLFRHVVQPGIAAMLVDAAEALAGCEVLAFHPKAIAGRHLAEAWQVPGWVVTIAPQIVPTAAFPAPGTIRADLGRLNRATYAVPAVLGFALRAQIGAWRSQLGLPPTWSPGVRMAGPRRLPVLHAHSRFLVPTPEDWDKDCHVTGFWTVAEAGRGSLGLPLVDFLDSGPAPLVVGFGAMTPPDAHATARLIVEAARRVRRRVVLVGLPEVDGADVISVANVSFRRLFPRAAATVHHGGAGTTAASLLAGIPMVLVPHALDQPFWAGRVQAAGVGASVPERALSASRLETALRLALRADVVGRAEQMGEWMRTERGAEQAASLILEAG